ncbi:hypothetical protein BGZ57DRAFT_937933 [Hyaloscypha finlandica]|nr:hypothetical protein BGZ57DRAFT_937933 [Hyaloscypha finlandica]
MLFSNLSFRAILENSLIAAVPYSEYTLSPDSRMLYLFAIHKRLFCNIQLWKQLRWVVSVTVGTSSSPDAQIGLTYTESSLWISGQASDATADAGLNEVLWLPLGKGYFLCGELLNRIWYAALNIDPAYGNALVHLGTINLAMNISLPQTDTRYNNATVAEGSSCVVDGAKRDRGLWPGDRPVAFPAYPLIGISYLPRYGGGLTYLKSVWGHFTHGMMNVPYAVDWYRVGMGGHIPNDNSTMAGWTPKAETLKKAANDILWNANAGLPHDNETNRVQQFPKLLKLDEGLVEHPAPEAGSPLTISPSIGSFELEAHLLSSDSQSALQLIRRQRRVFLDDRRMTNSTFIEGYSADGSLHCAPYTNDPRISHAHDWSTGPTSLPSLYVADIHFTPASGKTWKIAAQPGDLVENLQK